MKHLVIGTLLLSAPVMALHAQDMPVSEFLKRTDELAVKGSAAVHTNEYARLQNQLVQSKLRVLAEERAAKKAGQPRATCLPRNTLTASSQELFKNFRSLPADGTTTVKEAYADLMKKKFPCSAPGA